MGKERKKERHHLQMSKYYNNIRKLTKRAKINKLNALQVTHTIKHSENK